MIEKNKLKNFLIRTLADPVLLYTVLVMMSIMYHYRNRANSVPEYGSTVVYGLITYFVGWTVFRLFDYMNKKPLPGEKRSFLRRLLHSAVAFASYVFLLVVFYTAFLTFDRIGSENYPITWGLWFLTPQDSLEYNKWFAYAMYVQFLIFMLSVIYYFTRVRYRILMNFLIFVIPFAVYGKEYEKMPIGFIILMAVGYVLIMVTFRQLSDTDNSIVIDKPGAWKSAAVFTVIFALLSTLMPKPVVEEDRTIIETLINADALTDRLNAMLDVFRDTSDGQQFRGQQSSNPVYYVEADEPLRFKTATFSHYNFNTDSWSASDLDSYYSTHDSPPVNIYINGRTADAILYAAALDSDFAARYGLSEYVGAELYYPEDKTIKVYSALSGASTAPVPESAVSMTDITYNGQVGLSRAGAVFTVSGTFIGNDVFTYKYIPDGYFDSPSNREITDYLAGVEDYPAMLSEAYDIVYSAYNSVDSTDDDYQQLLRCSAVLNVNNRFYGDYLAELMDYGGSEKIYDLAQELTAGLESEIDKAHALEGYFYFNNYTYDLTYVKDRGENAEDFLFESKTGVCYEYATAMTLLARAAGIPARFCEGYNMQTPYEERGGKGYVITHKDAHAYPELYIKGYGWLSFEPTVSDTVAENNVESQTTTSLLSRAGLLMLAAAALGLLLILMWPALTHKLFIIRNAKREPDQAVIAALHRICRIYGLPRSRTVHEAEAYVRVLTGADISAAAALFDRVSYGGEKLDESDRQRAMDDYTAAYEALREKKKQDRKNKRNTKKPTAN